METLQLAPYPTPQPVELARPTDLVPPVYDSLSIPLDAAIAPQAEYLPANPTVEALSSDDLSLRQRIGNKVMQIAKAESVGTAFDVATMAVGVPLAVRETAGSVIDYKMYGQAGPEEAESPRNPSRFKKLAKDAGVIAMYAATGVLAQKLGIDVADSVNERLNDGVLGEYVMPLGAKLAAVTAVNAVVNKFSR